MLGKHRSPTAKSPTFWSWWLPGVDVTKTQFWNWEWGRRLIVSVLFISEKEELIYPKSFTNGRRFKTRGHKWAIQKPDPVQRRVLLKLHVMEKKKEPTCYILSLGLKFKHLVLKNCKVWHHKTLYLCVTAIS